MPPLKIDWQSWGKSFQSLQLESCPQEGKAEEQAELQKLTQHAAELAAAVGNMAPSLKKLEGMKTVLHQVIMLSHSIQLLRSGKVPLKAALE